MSCICPLLAACARRRHWRHGVLAPRYRMGVLARCSTYRGQQPHRSQPSAPTRLLDQAPTPAAPRTAASRGRAQGQQARDPEGKIHQRFEDDDTVHTVRHFVPGKSQGREGDSSRSDRSTSCWRCPSSRLLGLSRGGAAPCRQRLQSTVEQVASIDARPTASRALRGRPRSIGARCALVLMDVCLAPLRVRARRHALQLQLGKPLA